MKRRLRGRYYLAALFGVAASTQAKAQSIQGRVVAGDSAAPVAGALVVAWRAGSDTVRALASASGRFRAQLPQGGMYSVRVLRIGFSPSAVMNVAVPDRGEVSIEIRASALPIRLSTVAVRSDAICGPIRPDAPAIANVWEEARKAMLALQLESDGETSDAIWMEYERETDTTSRIVRSQRVRVIREPTRHVFASVSTDSLLGQGFVTRAGSETRYHAPDPAVLLSGGFTATHCFSLEPRTRKFDNDSTIGLRFSPVDAHSARSDISGVVWVNGVTGELRRIDFSYTNTPNAHGLLAGGTVEFARLATGQWVVSRWRAQLPVVQRRLGSAIPGMSALRSADGYIAIGIHATGGEVLRIEHAGTVLLLRDVPQLRVALTTRDTLVDVEGAIVEVEGTNLRGTTDRSGYVDLGPVPGGRYRVQVSLPRLDEAIPPQMVFPVEVKFSGGIDSLTLPSRPRLLESLCALPNTTRSDAGVGLLRGVALAEGGVPAAGAQVVIRFARTDGRAMRTGTVAQRDQRLVVETNARGEWRACGLPHSTDILVEGSYRGARASWRGRIELTRLSEVIRLQLASTSVANDAAVSTTAQPLAAVSVTSDRDTLASGPPKRSAGQHLNAQDIARMRVEHGWQLLARVTGIQLRRVGGSVYAVSSRGNAPSLQTGASACPLQLTINGATVTPRSADGVDLSDLPRPELIERLDVYASGAEIPVSTGSAMRGSWCGLIAVTLK